MSSAWDWLCPDPRNYCSLTYAGKDLGSVLDNYYMAACSDRLWWRLKWSGPCFQAVYLGAGQEAATELSFCWCSSTLTQTEVVTISKELVCVWQRWLHSLLVLLTWRNNGVSGAGNSCASLFLTDWAQLLNCALYLACKPFIPFWVLLQPFCLWSRRANGICEKPEHWRHSCRGLLQVFMPAYVTFLQLLCALGKGCAVVDTSSPASLLAAWALDLQCSLMCHTESRALSYLRLGFSLFWFPVTSQWEMLSNLYLILWLEAV